MQQCFSTVDFAAKTITASALAPFPRGQVDFYHVINGQKFPGHRITEVFEKATGISLDKIRPEAWWNVLDRSVPIDASPQMASPQGLSTKPHAATVSLDFLALVSLYLPRDSAEQNRVRNWHGREWSTIQLQDRLRRLATDSPDNDLYQTLLDGLRPMSNESLDRALAINLKSAWQEHKRREVLKHESPASLVVKAQQSTHVVAHPPPTLMVPTQRSTFEMKSYFSSTHALAFLSLLLYILLGD